MNKLRFTRSKIFNFTFIINLLAKKKTKKHKSHNYGTVQMVWSSVSTKVCQSAHVGSNLIFFFFSPNFFFIACSYQLNTFLTMLGANEGLEEADKVHVLDK